MVKKFLSLKWFIYYFTSLFEIARYSFPFRKNNPDNILICVNGGIAFVTCLIITGILTSPVIHFISNPHFTGFIEIIFVLVFTMFISFVARKLYSVVKMSGGELSLIQYGLLEKNITRFSLTQLTGLFILKENNSRHMNYKVCIGTKDHKSIMLYLTMNQQKADEKLSAYATLFGFHNTNPAGYDMPLNNSYTGGTNTDSTSF